MQWQNIICITATSISHCAESSLGSGLPFDGITDSWVIKDSGRRIRNQVQDPTALYLWDCELAWSSVTSLIDGTQGEGVLQCSHHESSAKEVILNIPIAQQTDEWHVLSELWAEEHSVDNNEKDFPRI